MNWIKRTWKAWCDRPDPRLIAIYYIAQASEKRKRRERLLDEFLADYERTKKVGV